MIPTLIFDMEVYQNYTLLLFKDLETKAIHEFELRESEAAFAANVLDQIRVLVTTRRIITFNGLGYDIPLLTLVLKGYTCLQIKQASDRIIVHNLRPWNFEKEFNVKLPPEQIDHIDLMEVAPLTGSLKLYGGRMHSYSMQDLPVEPGKYVDQEDMRVLRSYCENDCDTLIDLFYVLYEQINLRIEMSKEYGIDLRSKSNAQISEAVIRQGCEKVLGHKLDRPGMSSGDKFAYVIPSWMYFDWCDVLSTIKDVRFALDNNGKVIMPEKLKAKDILIGQGTYRMGIGGLHSNEHSRSVHADAEHAIMDFDVTSYYPAIILHEGLYPRHVGPVFLTVYQSIVDRRLAAKRSGQKTIAESLKIAANSGFGKMGSKWSALYAPDMMVQVTLTGQLALLMLIERLWEIDGCEVVSANTDGVTTRCARDAQNYVLALVTEWERETGLMMERVDYESLYSRDVNNYIAVKTNGEVKTKGAYGTGLPLQKNPNAQICGRAVIDYLTLDAPIEGTIRACQDIKQFICIRTVKGGATWHGTEIGRIVRWYYSTMEEESLLYKVNGHLVPKTLGGAPLMKLDPALPPDLDYDWYVKEAESMLNDLGVAGERLGRSRG